MGFPANVARDMQLTARASDLQFQINQGSFTIMQLASIGNKLVAQLRGLDLTSPEFQRLQVQFASIAQMERQINLFLENAKSQQAAVQQEKQAIQKAISENVKSFKTWSDA
jgi:hypothetical protein